MTKSRTAVRSASGIPQSAAERSARAGGLFRPTPVALAVSAALGMLPVVGWAQSAAALPVGCTVAATLCGGRAFDPARAGNAPTLAAPNLLTVNQGSASSAIFNWQSFNIGKGNTVQFLQSGPNAVALNRIFDNSASTIDGALKANGQIYLLNPNGIVFGGNARIDVGGLIASTLNMADSRVTRGLLSETADKAVFFNDPAFAAAAGNAEAGKIRVLPGAQLYAAGRDVNGTVVSAGRVFLFAPDVVNGGDIRVDGGGQVVLAAGNKVFLGSTSDPTLRGLLVEVADGVKVENTGSITTARGNITMMGLAVKQAGTLTASSAIRENGSIRLIARETTSAPVLSGTSNPIGSLFAASKTGVVDLAAGSTTRVVLDANDSATAPLNDTSVAAARSRITIEGGQVNIGNGQAGAVTRVEARGGDIAVSARTDVTESFYRYGDTSAPSPSLLGQERADAVVNVGQNAVIDASGLNDVKVDGARNFVFIERLTSSDMRDTPLQRDGFLRGQGVYMNVALDHAFIDNSARRAAVAGSQAERNAIGGTVALRAEGAVHLAQGAVVDVSGGSTVTSAGVGRTSQLLTATGRVVDITNATANQLYTGFADQATVSIVSPDEGIFTSTTYQAPKLSAVGGFSSGMAAGSVEITAPRATLEGTLLARTTVQPQQGASPPMGGELRIGSAANTTLTLDQQAYLQRASIVVGNDAAGLRARLSDAETARSIVVDADQMRRSGFTRFNLMSDGRIELAAGSALDLGAGGQFTAQGNQVSVNSDITAAGGRITLAERPITATLVTDARQSAAERRDALAGDLKDSPDRGSVALGFNVQLSTAGRWTNEVGLPASQVGRQGVVLNGGNIALSGRSVDVSEASFDVSAGALLTVGGTVRGGSGGNLSLSGSYREPAAAGDTPDTGSLFLGDRFADRIEGFGVTGSGTLAITSPSAVLSDVAPVTGPATWLDAGVIGTRGFKDLIFTGTQQMDVAAGTVFRPDIRAMQPTADWRLVPSTPRLLDVAGAQTPLQAQQKPAQITLRSSNVFSGETTVQQGAVLDAGTLGAVSVIGGAQVHVDGSLVARGGSVSVGLAPRAGANLSAAQVADRLTSIGAAAQIDVSGISRVVAEVDGRRSGDVLDAGRVDLSATTGSLLVDAQATINARGASDHVTPKGQDAASQAVASAGGIVRLSADQSLYVGLDASRARSVVDARGGAPGSNGGQLSVRLQLASVDGIPDQDLQAALQAPRQLLIDSVPAARDESSAGKVVGQVFSGFINDSGFDQVWLASADSIAFGRGDGTTPSPRVELAVKTSLSLDAQSLVGIGNSQLHLRAPYVAIGTAAVGQQARADRNAGPGAPASGGAASLDVQGRDIDLVGRFALQGIGQATLHASADVRGIGLAPGSNELMDAAGTRPTGVFSVGGNLRVEAAQVTPATYTDFTLASNAAVDAAGEGRIVIARAADAGTPIAPLSAGGSLNVRANDIVVDGRIAAPLGTIDLQGARSITASPTAELSVTGMGVVPFGTVASGVRWTYTARPGNSAVDIANAQTVNLPEKGVTVQAPSVDLQSGARIQVAGGGQLLGSEFVAGPGGSFDMTQNFAEVRNGVPVRNSLFALLPVRGTALAPFDPQTMRDLTLDGTSTAASVFRFGQTVTLGAGSGVPAGTYTVLPARYAVLPGAFAVQPVAGYTDLVPGTAVTEAAGTVVVAGRLGFAGAETQASRWSGYRVYNGAQFRKLSELKDYNGDTFTAPFAAALGVSQRLARDAGAVAIGADSIRLAAEVNAAPAVGGRGADVSITAPHIEVVSAAPETNAPGDTLRLAAGQLNGWAAETLVLGAVATRSDGDATLALARNAQTVNLQGATAVQAGEVILTASDTVSTGIGSAVQSNAARPPTRSVTVSGDGAALWVSASDSDALALTRSGGTATQGRLDLGVGSTLAGRNGSALRAGNVVFDASQQQHFGAGVEIRADGIGLSGSTVNLGEVPQGTSGLNLDNALLARLGSASRLTLASAGGFTVFGTATIGGTDASGNPALDLLRLKGQGIQGQGEATDTVRLTARNVLLDNSAPGNQAVAAAVGHAGLQVQAPRDAAAPTGTGGIAVAGNFVVSGFDDVALQAGADLRFQGAVSAGATLNAGAARLDVNAARITADHGVHATLRTTGNLNVGVSAAAPPTRSQEAGAMLALRGGAVDFGGRIDLPAGVVTIAATGTGADDNVTLRSGAVVDVAGQTRQFGPAELGATADLSAGSVSLSSVAGSVLQSQGSVIDIAGAGRAGDAGALNISAVAGSARLQGELRSAPGSAARGADLSVDAKTLSNVSEIATALNAGSHGSAHHSVDLRARQGDVVVAATDTLRAERITLAADGGNGVSDGSVHIAGRLEADGAASGQGQGGRVQVYARNQVEVSGVIDARARLQGAGTADGGQVLLSARIANEGAAAQGLDAIVLRDSAHIDVRGRDTATQLAPVGQVTLRAPSIGGNEVAVAALPAGAVNGGKTIVEGVILQDIGSQATVDIAAQQALLQSYMGSANRDAMTARLTASRGAAVDELSLRPGLEIRASGNLVLNTELNFAGTIADGTYNWRYGGTTLVGSDPGALTIRAGGNLALNESISDGFASTAPAAAVFVAGESWRYGFTAGSDLGAANPRQTVAAGAGSLTVGRKSDSTAQGAVIRTGTGAISMDAAQDVVLLNNSDATTARQGQVVYTAGVRVSDIAPGFFPQPRAAINPVLTSGGGDVDVRAGRDIAGTDPADSSGSNQSVSEWLWRGGLGTQTSPSVQWVNFGQFQQGWGALGGGNVTLRAKGDIVRAGASVASTGFVAGANERQYNVGALEVTAEGKVRQGLFYNEAGQFELRATAIEGDPAVDLTGITRLAQGSNAVDVQVREQADLVTPFNPTSYAPSKLLLPVLTSSAATFGDYRTTYFTYAPDSRFSLRAAAGDVSVRSVRSPSVAALQSGLLVDVFSSVAAPSVELVAFGGALSAEDLRLFPSVNASLRALAQGDIRTVKAFMSQSDPQQAPSAAAPFLYGPAVVRQDLVRRVESTLASASPLHAGDTVSSLVISQTGSISGTSLNMAEATEIHAAGKLIDGVQLEIQNQSPNSVSRISAGGGIDLTKNLDDWIRIYGPGAVEIVSGGAIDLGDHTQRSGLLSLGNLVNANLPAKGASLLVAAGTGLGGDGFALRPDYRNLVTTFLQNDAFASTGAKSATLNAEVIALLRKAGNEAGATELAQVLEAGLADRASVADPRSTVSAALAAMSPASLAVGSLRLASAVQEVTNARFVSTRNTDTFAPGYAVFNDLFPSLANSNAALLSFVRTNPFGASADAAALRTKVIAALRAEGGAAAAVATALALGVASPTGVDDPASAYALAVAALGVDQLKNGGRALLTQTLKVAGADLDALRIAGRVDADAGTPYARGLTEFASSFAPTGLPGLNDIGMAASQINVEQSGQLSLLSPRGSVLVGQPVSVDSKPASELGLFTLGGGSITAMARDNVDVYRSRVFTVAGGDIAMWSSLGNIDAGRGKTDAAVVAPPRLLLDPVTGIVKVDIGGAVTGSGIGALVSQPNQPVSDVTLIAPKGFIDAGEAGIRADRGRVTLGADVVLNTGSIKASSGVSGGKVVTAPPAPVPATSSGGNQASEAVEQTQRNLSAQQTEAEERAKKERRKRVTGEFIGFGDD